MHKTNRSESHLRRQDQPQGLTGGIGKEWRERSQADSVKSFHGHIEAVLSSQLLETRKGEEKEGPRQTVLLSHSMGHIKAVIKLPTSWKPQGYLKCLNFS